MLRVAGLISVALALGASLPGAIAAQAEEVPAPTPPEPIPRPRLLLLPTQSIGIDPIVGRFVDRGLRRAAEAMGYEVAPQEEANAALNELGASYPPNMAELWRATHRAGAQRGVFAVAWASGGRYRVQIRVASRDGRGPFYAQGEAGSADLEQQVGALLPTALPAPSATPEPSEPPPPPTRPESAPPSAAPAKQSPRFFEGPPPKPSEPYRYRIALHDDVAFGLSTGWFLNDVIGLRVDAQVADATFVGAHLGYADLEGRHGRAHSLLPYVQLEQRIPLAGRSLQVPLRFDLGYLIRNGGFLRLSSGLAIALGDRVELVLDLLAPTFWITPQTSLFSLDLAGELCVTL